MLLVRNAKKRAKKKTTKKKVAKKKTTKRTTKKAAARKKTTKRAPARKKVTKRRSKKKTGKKCATRKFAATTQKYRGRRHKKMPRDKEVCVGEPGYSVTYPTGTGNRLAAGAGCRLAVKRAKSMGQRVRAKCPKLPVKKAWQGSAAGVLLQESPRLRGKQSKSDRALAARFLREDILA